MMNTVRKSENLLPFPVISAAANGDTTAMCAILKHYEGYIAKLCTRTLKDDAGNTYVEKCKNELLHKAIEDSIQKAQVLTTAANVVQSFLVCYFNWEDLKIRHNSFTISFNSCFSSGYRSPVLFTFLAI